MNNNSKINIDSQKRQLINKAIELNILNATKSKQLNSYEALNYRDMINNTYSHLSLQKLKSHVNWLRSLCNSIA